VRTNGGGMGETRLPSKRGDPSHETTFPFFSDTNGNKIGNWVGEQENALRNLPNLPDRFQGFTYNKPIIYIKYQLLMKFYQNTIPFH
jgi:hypothetical protein